MKESGIGCLVPIPVPGMAYEGVLVMSRLSGFKATDHLALARCNVDKEALLRRIAHCSAYQLLVAGCFNCDVHPGNLMCCPSDHDGEALPGLLDFGMTAR
jgi:predicted unusual protein kinase regulating ubiquinone biosynthesis (AarF/ABC1/UbiB family)